MELTLKLVVARLGLVLVVELAKELIVELTLVVELALKLAAAELALVVELAAEKPLKLALRVGFNLLFSVCSV